VLNPETSSLSPSAKSKGVRLVSASKIINHIKNNLGKIINEGCKFVGFTCFVEMKFKVIKKETTTKINLIS